MNTLDLRPLLKQTITFRKTTADTNGELLEMEMVNTDNNGPPLHFHPNQEESFHILSGSMMFYLDGAWTKKETGETVVIQKGKPHTFKKGECDEVKFITSMRPALTFEKYMFDIERIIKSRDLKTMKNFKTLIYVSTLWVKYKENMVSIKPPYFVMFLLSKLGKILGYKIN